MTGVELGRARDASRPLRILVAGPEPLVRVGARCTLLGDGPEVVVEEAGTPSELAAALEAPPDIVVLDERLAGASIADQMRLVKKRAPDARMIVLGSDGDADAVKLAFAEGAAGYVSRKTPPARLLAAIKEVALGGRYLDPRLGAQLACADRPSRSERRLTTAERQVLGLVVDGLTSREIAARVGRPIRTVEGIRRRGQRKLGVAGRAELVELAHRRGL